MTHRWILLCCFTWLVLLGTGCAKKMAVHDKNMLMFDKRGYVIEPGKQWRTENPNKVLQLSPKDYPACGRDSQLVKPQFKEEKNRLTVDELKIYLQDMREEIECHIENKLTQGRTPRVMIFIHGGLNKNKSTMNRVDQFLKHQKAAPDSDPIKDIYPIFINWNSSLINSYLDHLLYLRNGKTFKIRPNRAGAGAVVGIPFLLAADLGKAITRAPYSYIVQVDAFRDSLFWTREGRNLRRKTAEYQAKYQQCPDPPSQTRQDPGEAEPCNEIPFYGGRDLYTTGQKTWSGATYTLSSLSHAISSIIVEALGTPAWNVMLRRTDELFTHPQQAYQDLPSEDYAGSGGLPHLLNMLQDLDQSYGGTLELSLIGHSMGAIIVNGILSRFPDIKFDHLVYLAAACSVKEYERVVYPYLLHHNGSSPPNFYHLMLHPNAEARERNCRGLLNLLVPRGSLLVYIDNFFANAKHETDFTAGRAANLIPYLNHVPPRLKPQIHVKVLPAMKQHDGKHPQGHGEFDELAFAFWDPNTWEPMPDEYVVNSSEEIPLRKKHRRQNQ